MKIQDIDFIVYLLRILKVCLLFVGVVVVVVICDDCLYIYFFVIINLNCKEYKLF